MPARLSSLPGQRRRGWPYANPDHRGRGAKRGLDGGAVRGEAAADGRGLAISGECSRAGSSRRHAIARVGWQRDVGGTGTVARGAVRVRGAARSVVRAASGVRVGIDVSLGAFRDGPIGAVYSGRAVGAVVGFCGRTAAVVRAGLAAAVVSAGLTAAVVRAGFAATMGSAGLAAAVVRTGLAATMRSAGLAAAVVAAAMRSAGGGSTAGVGAAETAGMDHLCPAQRQGRRHCQTDRCFVHKRHLSGNRRTTCAKAHFILRTAPSAS